MPNLRDRVKCAVTGTPTIAVGTPMTIGAAAAGARSFATAYGADKTNITVVVDDGVNWQVGIGYFTYSAGTFNFDVIDASSNGGAAITLSGSATISVEYLSRDHDADWPFMEATYSGTMALVDTTFTTLVLPTVVSDTHSGFNNSTGIYTVPQKGTYDILLSFRVADGSGGGNQGSYGIGVDTSDVDSSHFSWFVAAPNSAGGGRNGAQYRRISAFNAGDQLRPFYYNQIAAGTYLTNADLAIVRIR